MPAELGCQAAACQISSPSFLLPASDCLFVLLLAGSSNACDETPCTAGAVAVDNCKNLAPPALGNAPGRVCTCPPGYFYTEAQGCQGELAMLA